MNNVNSILLKGIVSKVPTLNCGIASFILACEHEEFGDFITSHFRIEVDPKYPSVLKNGQYVGNLQKGKNVKITGHITLSYKGQIRIIAEQIEVQIDGWRQK